MPARSSGPGMVAGHLHGPTRGRSQAHRGLDRQPPRGPDDFTVGMWHWGTPDPQSARTAGAPCRLAGVRQPHPHLLAHVFQMIGFTWEYLGLSEDFGCGDAQKTPRSPNAPEH